MSSATLSSSCYRFVIQLRRLPRFLFFFLNDPAPTEISPLPLHAALPISRDDGAPAERGEADEACGEVARVAVCLLVHDAPPRRDSGRRRLGRKAAAFDIGEPEPPIDRKSTRLNSSH